MIALRRKNIAFILVSCVCIFGFLKVVEFSSSLFSLNEQAIADEELQNYHGLELRPNVEIGDPPCPLPQIVQYGQPWPSCLEKVNWLTESWKSHECYAKEGVNGSVCSILEYLSTKERHCPPRRDLSTQALPTFAEKITGPRTTLQDIVDELSQVPDFTWIASRIMMMQDLWADNARKLFEATFKGKSFQKKKIHLHLGLMELGMGMEAQGGGALGELVQWSDLIASLHIIGHELTITRTKRELIYLYTNFMFHSALSRCSLPPSPEWFQFDLVYTDIHGFQVMSKLLPKFDSIKCRFRILDSFGTEAQFNVGPPYKSNPFGALELILSQFNTMYPHSPDNTFLGFVVETPSRNSEIVDVQTRDIALVYGKDGAFWREKTSYLKIVEEYFPNIHATVVGDLKEVPEFVVNHGVLPLPDLHNLLKRTIVLVGLGFPFEGPAPLEAIARGAVFINPKFKEPLSGNNNKFFRNKPTNRSLTSQNPYAETYIGEPHVYTVDVTNEKELRNALDRISMYGSHEPYLPYEFSSEGMIERVAVLVENQDFCTRYQFSGPFQNTASLWPPISSLRIVPSEKNCKQACHDEGLICEPNFFPAVNTKEAFEATGMDCKYVHYPVKPQTGYPAYYMKDKACCIQTHNLYFDCVEKLAGFQRLCPCRDYKKGQVALCKHCV